MRGVSGEAAIACDSVGLGADAEEREATFSGQRGFVMEGSRWPVDRVFEIHEWLRA